MGELLEALGESHVDYEVPKEKIGYEMWMWGHITGLFWQVIKFRWKREFLHVHNDEHKVSTEIAKNQLEKLRDLWNSKLEVQCENPQAQNHSNKVRIIKDINWSRELSVSLNVQELLSFHANHIKHEGATFQISEECFLN